MTQIAVVGAGISGLSAAHALRQRAPDLDLVVLEAADRPGGVLHTHREAALLLEEGPDSLVRTKATAIDLCDQLGVPLIGTQTEHARSLVVRNSKLVPVPPGFQLVAPTRVGPMITTPLFSWPAKLRMACDLVLPKRAGCSDDDDESLGSFVRRRLGAQALDRLIQPLIAGIYAGDPDELSLRSTLPMLLDLEHRHRSLILGMRATSRARQTEEAAGARYSLFVTPRDGMGSLVGTLAESLGPDTLRCDEPVRALRRRENGWTLVLNGERSLEAGTVIVALPSTAAAALLEPVDPQLARSLAAVRASSMATVNLVWPAAEIEHPLDGFGFVCPRTEAQYLLACTFTSRKYEGRSDDHHVVLRAFVSGGAVDDDDDDAMLASVRANLEHLLGITAPPSLHRIRRFSRSMPCYDLGHLQRVEEIRNRLSASPTLALAGNVYQGVGISDCILSGRAAASRVLDTLGR